MAKDALKDPRHEEFCQLIATGHSQTAAYAEAYQRDKDKSAESGGARLAKREEVAERIEQLKAKEARRFDVNQKSLTKHYVDLVEIAKEDRDVAAARGCLDSLAKLHGLMIDRAEVNGTVRHIGELHLNALKDLMGYSTGRRDKHLKVVDAQVEPVDIEEEQPKAIANQ